MFNFLSIKFIGSNRGSHSEGAADVASAPGLGSITPGVSSVVEMPLSVQPILPVEALAPPVVDKVCP
ncbi:hypothetical protein A2U01_0066655, partial [Trifolium medium]|nr:hypothetical protein [Trifolium medium]